MEPEKILIVEDEFAVAEETAKMIEYLGYSVAGVTPSGEEAVTLALAHTPDLILMDIRLNGAMDGIEAAEQISKKADIPIIYLTAYSDEETLQRAKKTQPSGYLLKPFRMHELNVLIDITLYKNTMKKLLRQKEQSYQLLFETSNDAIFIFSKDAHIIEVNKRACLLTGYDKEILLGRNFYDLCLREDAGRIKRQMKQTLEKGEGFFQAALIDRSGAHVDVEISANPADSTRDRIQAIVRDITQRKVLEKRLHDSEKWAAQGQMAARIAHEINNPLGGIKNAFMLIKDAVNDDHPHFQYVGRIEDEIERIARIIRSMLDMYRPAVLKRVNTDVETLAHDVCDMVSMGNTNEKVNIETVCLARRTQCMLPRDALVQILINLIQNAIDATEDGSVQVRFKEEDNTFIVTVEDHGSGIPEDVQGRVFDPFLLQKRA